MTSKVGIGLLRWLLVLTSLTLFFPCGLSLHLSLHAEPRSASSLLALRDVPVNTTRSPHAPPRLRNATAADLETARAVVKGALSEAAVRNKARLDHPSRNRYTLRPGTQLGGAFPATRFTSSSNETASEEPPPLLEITPEIADAAALLAEADADASVNRSAPTPTVRKRAGYWMEDISRKGSWPFKKDDSYRVLRNVKDFGAVGDGVTEDTAAIRSAINSTRSRRCAEGCNGSTLHNTVVYFPSGTYLVSSTIYAIFGTQMIGNPNDPPVILGAPSFVGLGVFSTDEYVPNGGTGPDGNANEWYINTVRSAIRNFKFDITQTDPGAYICAIHYQVAQATSLSNVEFNVGAPPTTQQAIFAENGSGGVMSDLTFNGGNFGIYGGSQQFTAQRLKFRNCATAVQLIWDWGWTWKSIDISGCTTGFKLVSEDGTHHTGSILLLDSTFTNTGTAILTFSATKELAKGTTGITLDNVAFDNVQSPVVDTEGKVYLPASVGSVDTWVLGPIYSDSRVRGDSLSMTFTTDREKSLLGSSRSGLPKLPFFERARPQYENEGAASFVHMKDYAKGDGSTDDTEAFQKALNDNAGSKIIFVDAGSYILTDTITVPAGARIVGEAWSQLVALGDNFGDASNPRPLLRVGKRGDVGSVEIQDLLFTSKGPTPGTVLVEWNIKASSPGAAGMWDSHVRLGGAEGTELTSKQCPPSTSGTNSGCSVGSLMMHITPGSSALLDNVWLWLADRGIGGPGWEDGTSNMVQMSVYVSRGLLVESTDATWLYGTSSEHAVMYQYNFWKARNVFAGMIQSESPYYQPTPKPPAPFAGSVGKFAGDWEYDCQNSDASGCDASWALLVRNSTDIFIAGAGLYSWFTTYTQDCVDKMNCQQSLILVEDNFEHVRIHNLITVGAVNMIESDGYKIKSADNLAVDFHPYWSQISVFDPIQNEPDACEGRLTEPNGDDPQQTDGSYPPALPVGTNPPALPNKNYLSIVNGSPYNFKLTSTHTNQMTGFEWHDIPAGESRQNMFEYRATSYAVDDKGEAYYEIEGTGKTFVVLIRTDYDNDGDHFLAKLDYRGLSTDDAAEGTIYSIYTSGGGHDIEWYQNPDWLAISR
ncbi:pectate lyase superfamily protein-domain-containing protein [Dichotomopilus funicola]|uniref:Pectate lyase superfamily protein-domain-containing protein n=1 Tax=Dichotomopilus funicola TaxID=1934379 RepID=A0AAN6ZKX8_9PEZI|nr:pectate lyase superfamily protein-domain-containing protein [Dichotomopilus funicola]